MSDPAPFPLSPPPAHRPLSSDNDAPPERRCPHCRKPVPSDSVWKACDSCREKRRNYKREYLHQKKQQNRASLSSQNVFSSSPIQQVLKKRKLAHVADASGASGSAGPDRLSVQQFLRDYSGGIKKQQKRTHKRKKDVIDPECDEYICSDYALSALKASFENPQPRSSSEPSYLNFSLTYAVVADPAIDNQKRIDEVVASLRADAGMKFSVTPTIVSPGSSPYARPHALTEKRRCKCAHVDKTRAEQAPPGPVPLKRKQSGLKNYFNRDPPPAPAVKCGGFVYISSEYDTSHAYGIRGQRVVVTVVHLH